MICISKQSKQHVDSDSGSKSMILKKKFNFLTFSDFFFIGVTKSNFYFSIFQDFKKKFLNNGLNGTFRMLKETKS